MERELGNKVKRKIGEREIRKKEERGEREIREREERGEIK